MYGMYVNYRDSRRSGPAPGGALFEDASLYASASHVTALSPRPGRCGAAVDAAVGAAGSAGAADFDGGNDVEEVDEPWASHFE